MAPPASPKTGGCAPCATLRPLLCGLAAAPCLAPRQLAAHPPPDAEGEWEERLRLGPVAPDYRRPTPVSERRAASGARRSGAGSAPHVDRATGHGPAASGERSCSDRGRGGLARAARARAGSDSLPGAARVGDPDPVRAPGQAGQGPPQAGRAAGAAPRGGRACGAARGPGGRAPGGDRGSRCGPRCRTGSRGSSSCRRQRRWTGASSGRGCSPRRAAWRSASWWQRTGPRDGCSHCTPGRGWRPRRPSRCCRCCRRHSCRHRYGGRRLGGLLLWCRRLRRGLLGWWRRGRPSAPCSLAGMGPRFWTAGALRRDATAGLARPAAYCLAQPPRRLVRGRGQRLVHVAAAFAQFQCRPHLVARCRSRGRGRPPPGRACCGYAAGESAADYAVGAASAYGRASCAPGARRGARSPPLRRCRPSARCGRHRSWRWRPGRRHGPCHRGGRLCWTDAWPSGSPAAGGAGSSTASRGAHDRGAPAWAAAAPCGRLVPHPAASAAASHSPVVAAHGYGAGRRACPRRCRSRRPATGALADARGLPAPPACRAPAGHPIWRRGSRSCRRSVDQRLAGRRRLVLGPVLGRHRGRPRAVRLLLSRGLPDDGAAPAPPCSFGRGRRGSPAPRAPRRAFTAHTVARTGPVPRGRASPAPPPPRGPPGPRDGGRVGRLGGSLPPSGALLGPHGALCDPLSGHPGLWGGLAPDRRTLPAVPVPARVGARRGSLRPRRWMGTGSRPSGRPGPTDGAASRPAQLPLGGVPLGGHAQGKLGVAGG